MKQHSSKLTKADILYLIKAFALLLLLTLSTLVNGQSKFGVKSAYGIFNASPSSIMHSHDGLVYSEEITFIENQSSSSLGFFFVKDFDRLFFQFDLLYSQYDALYSILFFSEEGSLPVFALEKFRNVDVSFLAGYNWKKFDIGVGPVFYRKMELDSGLSTYDFITDKSTLLNAGFQFSLGYTLGPIKAEVRWVDLFSKAGDHIGFVNRQSNKFNNHLSLVQFHIGIGF